MGSSFRVEYGGPLFPDDDPDLPKDPAERMAVQRGLASYFIDDVVVSEEEFNRRMAEEARDVR